RFALELRRDEDDPGQRPAAPEDVADVFPDGAGRAGEARDGRGPRREWPLAGGIEKAFGGETRLERLEPQGQVTEARRLDRFDVDLERALRLEQVDPPVCDDTQPG